MCGSFYIHRSVFMEGDKSSWRLDSSCNIDSTVYPLLTLFTLLKIKPYQKVLPNSFSFLFTLQLYLCTHVVKRSMHSVVFMLYLCLHQSGWIYPWRTSFSETCAESRCMYDTSRPFWILWFPISQLLKWINLFWLACLMLFDCFTWLIKQLDFGLNSTFLGVSYYMLLRPTWMFKKIAFEFQIKTTDNKWHNHGFLE